MHGSSRLRNIGSGSLKVRFQTLKSRPAGAERDFRRENGAQNEAGIRFTAPQLPKRGKASSDHQAEISSSEASFLSSGINSLTMLMLMTHVP